MRNYPLAGRSLRTCRSNMAGLIIVFAILFGNTPGARGASGDITPFQVQNQSPLVQIYGLPRDTGAEIVPSGAVQMALLQDLASNYTVGSSRREQITLDGETYRLTVVARYGFSPRGEIGVELPYLVQGGGFLDSFIIDWHNTFGLPQGGRTTAPRNRLNYSYRKDGVSLLQMDHGSSGIGDLAVTGGYRLADDTGNGHHDRLALKGKLKLPTGDSTTLAGSGGVDALLQLCGSRQWGTVGLYGSVGGLVMAPGDLLGDQHNPLAATGSLGFGWLATPLISLKIQLNGTTPLYRDSSLAELSSPTLMLTMGGALHLPDNYLLDIGVVEDVAVATAPDVSFHLGVSRRF